MRTVKYFFFNNYIYKKLSNYFPRLEVFSYHFNKNFDKKIKLKLVNIFRGEFKVLSGPFKEMVYLDRSSGSSFFPKIIGSYEFELHGLLEMIKNRDYKQIYDIGCAEGYYAVGLSRMFKESEVFAFDLNPECEFLVEKLSRVNGTLKVTFVKEGFIKFLNHNSEYLRSLFIFDCEGCEYDVFNSYDISKLKKSDLLFEVHDYLNPAIGKTLISNFSNSHSTTKIDINLDIRSKRNLFCSHPIFKSFTYFEKLRLVEEGRYSDNYWLFFESRIK